MTIGSLLVAGGAFLVGFGLRGVLPLAKRRGLALVSLVCGGITLATALLL